MKKLISIILLCGIVLGAFAVPGINEYVPTENGQYVYYRDFSQENETYIGFLYYDESTLSSRCFAKDKNGKMISSIQLFFSMDPKANHIEFVGEKIPDNATNADVETINYIHNMIYELASKRMNSNGDNLKKVFSKTQDFEQFGGKVEITYDYSIPVFNIESVCDFEGKPLFQAVTFGSLSSNKDASFEKFSGFPEQTKTYKEKLLNKIFKKNFEWEGSKDLPETIKTLGDNAIMWNLQLDYPEEELAEKGIALFDYFKRINRQSSDGSYVYLPTSRVKTSKKHLRCDYTVYSPNEESKTTHVIKILTKDKNGISLKIVNVNDKFYQENKSYFDSIK